MLVDVKRHQICISIPHSGPKNRPILCVEQPQKHQKIVIPCCRYLSLVRCVWEWVRREGSKIYGKWFWKDFLWLYTGWMVTKIYAHKFFGVENDCFSLSRVVVFSSLLSLFTRKNEWRLNVWLKGANDKRHKDWVTIKKEFSMKSIKL